MKKITLILLAAVMALSLAACGKFKCDFCQEEKFGKINKTTIFDQEMQYCNDCKEDLQDLAEDLKDLT